VFMKDEIIVTIPEPYVTNIEMVQGVSSKTAWRMSIYRSTMRDYKSYC